MSALSSARWLNAPPKWSQDGDRHSVTTGKNTDFWQNTHYGFVHDDGHFRYVEANGDFTASVQFEGRYEQLYDQAGLMMRTDARNWIKLGIEFSDAECNFSFVCTIDGRSDWSVIPSGKIDGPQTVRITRVGDAVIAHFRRRNDDGWQMMRLCPFPRSPVVKVGPMTCSPQRAGFEVTFHMFRIDPPIPNPLHG